MQLILVFAIFFCIFSCIQSCEPPDCDRPDLGTCGNKILLKWYCLKKKNIEKIDASNLFSELKGIPLNKYFQSQFANIFLTGIGGQKFEIILVKYQIKNKRAYLLMCVQFKLSEHLF